MNQLPLFTPDSPWEQPTELPDLRGRKEVALDTETHDMGLENERGPGWPTRMGRIVGVSWAAEDSVGYAPIAHPDTLNQFPKEQVGRWLNDLVKSGTRLVFQNAPYDIGWMFTDLGVDIQPEHPIEDALCMAFMIDENQLQYNLDAICTRLGIAGKNEALLMEAGVAYLRPPNALKSWKLTRKLLKANIHRLPARYVGPYAEDDAAQTLAAVHAMRPTIDDQKLEKAYRLEMDLVPLVRMMRSRGIKIDVDKVQQNQREMRVKRDNILAEIKRRLPRAATGGGDLEMTHLRSNKWMEPVFEAEGIQVPYTAPTSRNLRGQASFKQEWMDKSEHWLPKMVSSALGLDRFVETFLGEFILGYTANGRLHAEIHQYKSDDGGTVSYRFAYSHPPLQQAPSPDRNKEQGEAFRDVMVADEGCVWGSNDYSQQEYRLTAHFAALTEVKGGQDAADNFINNPDLDYHKMVADMSGLGRPRAKILNFALLYGQGIDATAHGLGCDLDEAKDLRDKVAERAPFGPALDDYCRLKAQQRGYLRLIDGARVRFDTWESGFISRVDFARAIADKIPMMPCTLEEALARQLDKYHPWYRCQLRRAGVRKALNRLIQGSAARQTKIAMRECGRAKLIPVLQMHDELNHVEDSPAKIAMVSEIMRTAVKLRLPMKVDMGYGRSWAAAKAKDAPKAPPIPYAKPPTTAAEAGLAKRLQNGRS